MRHTLIPTDLKKALRHEYRVRALIVLLFMLSAAFVVGIVSVLPAFIHAATQKSVAESSLLALGGTVSTTTQAEMDQELSTEAAMLSILNSPQAASDRKNPISSIISSIAKARGPVALTSLSVSKTATTTVIVQGKAPTRESLLSFQNRLKESLPGNVVDLPVSELAKSADIRFSLSITNAIADNPKP